MKTVESINDIKTNIQTLDKYLNGKHEPEYSFALGLVKRGTCFIAVRHGSGYRFYPSRFIGYIENNMDKHENNDAKDGRVTNPAISKILHANAALDPELEREYREYCEALGFMANDKGTFGVERKYWRFI